MTTSPQTHTTAKASTDKRLQIDVWGDLACPWCYIGKNRLDQAIAASPHAEAITVKVHSFELDPHMSQEAKPNLELLAAKYSLSPADAARMEDKVAAIAHQEGLPYTGDRVLANSFDVHRVLHLADTLGLADQLLGVLQRAQFSGHANVYDHAVLTDTATQLGIPRNRVEAVLSSNEYADAVRADETQARELGITGVPYAVFDGRIAIPGSTDTGGYTNAINQAWSDQ
ncbi:DsbA family oxidoreductase [Rudaeicoccus suwonensis]|uniref:Putative DsbA family dithiol-disulfide isomerase n=1 Tax=Rudaeicoccus suwonensis TaxID=657409 RepID=A0A561E426_9MICO|nr:DsbA family oxidoreductase [Rudaeicoccus suwonensis]TWE10362.1 putative DsbA family dithiol-disulfide isomerase [Rudaeicoccus suwonensis]